MGLSFRGFLICETIVTQFLQKPDRPVEPITIYGDKNALL